MSVESGKDYEVVTFRYNDSFSPDDPVWQLDACCPLSEALRPNAFCPARNGTPCKFFQFQIQTPERRDALVWIETFGEVGEVNLVCPGNRRLAIIDTPIPAYISPTTQ